MMSLLSMEGDQILPSLQEGARSHSAGPRRVRLRKWLLSLEVGLTVVLLIGAGLLLKSYQRMRASHLGCITNNVVRVRLKLSGHKISPAAQHLNFFLTLLHPAPSF